ncbi:MAG: hypothetical protein WBV80_24795 [Mycobacterium sp.]
MATMPALRVACGATFGVCALVGAVLAGPAQFVRASVPTAVGALSHDASSLDPDADPAPLIQDPPEVHGPSNPGQKTLTPQHHKSHHRAPY